MAELVVSYHVYGGKSNPVGQRVWDDGRVESYLVSKLEKTESGAYDYVPVVPDWYPTTQLNDSQLAEVTQALDQARVGEIPEHIDHIVHSRTDTTTAIWNVRVPEGNSWQVKEIRVAQWGPLAPEAQPLMVLLMKLHQIINSTLVAQS